MKKRQLGLNRGTGLEVSAIGFACRDDGRTTRAQQLALLRAASDFGTSFFDASQATPAAERLLGEAMTTFRHPAVIATGFCVRGTRPGQVRAAAEASLQRLGVEAIDLFHLRHLELSAPIEDVAGAVQDLIRAGKVQHFGLCDVDVASLRRAHAVQPVSAVRVVYSPWQRTPEHGLLQSLEVLGIGCVACGPLAGGARLDVLAGLAARKHATPAQLVLAWLLAQQPWIVPVLASRRIGHADENLGGADLRLNAEDLREIGALCAQPALSAPPAPRGTACVPDPIV